MPPKMNNKHKMYDFEKIGLVIALVITVAIVSLVVFATKGSGRTSSRGDSATVGSTDNSAGDGASAGVDSLEGALSASAAESEVDFTVVTVDNASLGDGALVLVNQEHEYKVNVEDKLVNVFSYNGDLPETKLNWYGLSDVSQSLRKEVVDALNSMYRDYYAALEKADVVITKTYVDSAAQQAEYDELAQSADPTDKPYLQAGGFSEHQTGLAFNLRNGDPGWFSDNCWKYGFVQRYPEGKESVTYVKDETNHYRYVGVPHALYMKLNKLVLEEYLGLLQTKTYNSRLKLDDGTSDKYETYAVKAQPGAETELYVPSESSGWDYTVSGTNNGFFVVTISKKQG